MLSDEDRPELETAADVRRYELVVRLAAPAFCCPLRPDDFGELFSVERACLVGAAVQRLVRGQPAPGFAVCTEAAEEIADLRALFRAAGGDPAAAFVTVRELKSLNTDGDDCDADGN